MAKTFTITKSPDTKHKDGSAREDAKDRQQLAEVFEGGVLIDSAYFATKPLAESWVRDVYKLL